MDEKKRITFFIDGSNFYYGIKNKAKIDNQWNKYHWMDFVKLFSAFLKEDEKLVEINYFTARPKNRGVRERQNLLLSVNKKLNPHKFKVHYGKYQDKIVKCRADCKKEYLFWEEKQTDVKLSVKIIEDCILNRFDKLILVSADTDFLPPIRFIKQYNLKFKENKQSLILFPPKQFSNELNDLPIPTLRMDRYKSRFNKGLLPEEMELKGEKYFCPSVWK